MIDRAQSAAKQAGKRKATQDEIVDQWLEAYKTGVVTPLRSEPAHPTSPYRPANIEWHDRLEIVLNDPDEAMGIQKNLEWAVKTVKEKPPPKKHRSG